MVEITQLHKEYKFHGQVTTTENRHSALIFLKTDLSLQIFLPILDDTLLKITIEMLRGVEGHLQDWELKADEPKSIKTKEFKLPNKESELYFEKEDTFVEDNYNKPWCEISYFPNIMYFYKKGANITIPDEWGISFYPEKNNTTLFKFFDNSSRNPRRMPTIFSKTDRSLYFSNKGQWSVSSIKERLEIITSCLSLFTGAPLSYEILLGRYEKEVIYMQFKTIDNTNAFICPSKFNGHAYIKENFIATFASDFTKKAEDIFNSPEREKILILLSYYRILFMTLFDEAKIAFSFQLMEALALYKRIKIRNSLKNSILKDLNEKLSKILCSSCYGLIKQELKPETDDFDDYIEKALDAINLDLDAPFTISPREVKEIAKAYRNQVFHGNFFKDMGEIDNIINRLPPDHKNDLPVLLQAIVSVIGANIILGIDFSQLTAVKRRMY